MKVKLTLKSSSAKDARLLDPWDLECDLCGADIRKVTPGCSGDSFYLLHVSMGRQERGGAFQMENDTTLKILCMKCGEQIDFPKVDLLKKGEHRLYFRDVR